ncbi:hypothetical protein J8I87_11020 [Paraburkholderia sp. LEh10]|uniref:hypothetical protein n=1 Tax=Paraburkholderia sp. LEh10 TaxID=2821353 RepID=UPI001AEAA729|nr:hypothetical protein [Paraburkholderia sp. LEh10]MBP0590234.1 hypothetical protein [Paraburkholderia sp. LEh10]
MILHVVNNKLYEVKLAFLNLIDKCDVTPRYFSTSEQIISFLKNNPGLKFSLVPSQPDLTDVELTAMSSYVAYGPQLGDVLCGVVSYDSEKQQVLTIGSYADSDLARLWGG